MNKPKFPAYFNISNASGDEAVIDIFGDIGSNFFGEGFSKEMLRDALKNVGNVANIIVNISSYGGSLDDGLVIFDMLRQHPAKVTTKVYGFTASAATVIAQAGNERTISENAMYLIHQPSTGVWGNVNEIERAAEEMKTFNEQLINLYKKTTGMTRAQVTKLIGENDGNGKWLTPAEAKEYGLVDKIFSPDAAKATARFTAEIMNNYNLPEIPIDMTTKKEGAPGIFAEIREMFGDILSAVRGTEKDGATKPVVTNEMIDALEARIAESETQNAAAQAANAELTSQIEAINARFTELEAENTRLNEAVETANEANNTLNASVTERDARITALEDELSAFNRQGAEGTQIPGIEGREGEGSGQNPLTQQLTNDLKAIQDKWNLVGHEVKGGQSNDR